MTQLVLHYPVNPHQINRGWGVADPLYARFGFARHNGVDLALVDGQGIHAPFSSTVTKIGNEPEGSGLYICLLSRSVYHFPDGKQARVELTFMHLSETLVRVGDTCAVGTPIATGGHSGLTTGSHTHLSPKRVTRQRVNYSAIDHNDAANTFDPTPYWSGLYAQDAGALSSLSHFLRRLIGA